MWKEAKLAKFEVLFGHLPWETDEGTSSLRITGL
jgi:hypothetical protein